jgi:hypothetical protein
VIAESAAAIASIKVSRVGAATFFNSALIFEKASSMGLKSGE